MSHIELDLLVEVTPWSLSDVPSPAGAMGGDPAYEEWASQCFEEAGIADLIVGRWFVRASAVRGPLAQRMVTLECERQDVGADDFDVDENAAAMDGGVGVWVDGVLVSQPACCSDVRAEDWLAPDTVDWVEIWNGHDGHRVEVRNRGSDVELRVDGTTVGRLPRTMFQAAAQSLRAMSRRLASDLEPHLPEGPERQALARRFAGVEGAP